MRSSILLALALSLSACSPEPVDDTGPDVDTPDPNEPVAQDDRDGDTILDVHEGEDDPDNDGRPNADDKDSDGDLIRDIIEAGDEDLLTLPVDSDGDGVPDFLDLDSDGNCLPDVEEAGLSNGGAVDSDGDGVRDVADMDNDGDGADDIYEMDGCDLRDTDGDGMSDHMDLDSDGDGVEDVFEAGTTAFQREPVDSDGDGVPDLRDNDSDEDGLTDREERGAGVVPNDTDGDGLYDFRDADSDGDGLSDRDEAEVYGTDPYDFDTDGDGFSDGAEILAHTDPIDGTSVIDGLYVVVPERTEVEEDFLFELRIQKGDVVFLTDTTGSMNGTITAVKSTYDTVLTDLGNTFDDVGGGAARYDDYNFGDMGAGLDKPFDLTMGVTTDHAAVKSAVASWSTHSGNDWAESTVEALYQAASGAGYDQNCDGRYDASDDVLPFLADSADPFGGTAGEHYDSTLLDAGTAGGMGFRRYALPVIIYATDATIRDPESAFGATATPGGCPIDASSSDVVTAVGELGAYLIAVNVSTQPITSSMNPQLAMVDLAERTGSYADIDGDGLADDVLVHGLDQNAAGFEKAFSDFVISAVDQLVSSITFSEVRLEIDGDEYGFVTSISPESYTDLGPDQANAELPFTLQFRGAVSALTEDQTFLLTLNVVGDRTTLLDSKDILVVVPGRK